MSKIYVTYRNLTGVLDAIEQLPHEEQEEAQRIIQRINGKLDQVVVEFDLLEETAQIILKS